MAIIHVLDKQSDEIIETLNSAKGEYTDAKKTDTLDNRNTFDFIALKKFEKLEKRNRLLVEDVDGFFSEYLITFTDQYKHNEKEVRSVGSFVDLQKSKVIAPQKLEGQTPQTAVEFALNGTEYLVGDVDFVNIRTITIEEHTNPYDLLKLIASTFDLELRFRVEVRGNQIVGRYVDLKKYVGHFEGKEIVFGKDLVGIRRIEDSDNIVTALLGIGPEREDGTRLTVLVENEEARQRWGRNGQHLISVYEPESTDQDMTEARLRTLTENELEKRIDASVRYEGEAVSLEKVFGRHHEKIRLGMTVKIKDEGYSPPLYLQARIHETTENPATREIISFKIGDFIEYRREDLEKQVKALRILLAQKVSDITALGNRVITAENNISALQGEITQKVSQSTFNVLENRVTQAESTITQTENNVTFAFERIDNIDGKLNSATTTIDETGVTVKNGSFFLVDEISNMKSHAVFRRNYIKDHSFEALREGAFQSDGTRTLIVTAKNPWYGWFAVGNPKLNSIFETDALNTSVMFGLKEVIVNNSNYLYQYIDAFPNKTYTFSVHARKFPGLTVGNLRVRIRCFKLDGYGNPVYVSTNNFDFSTSGNSGEIARYGGSFTTTSDTEHIEVSFMTTSSNWITVDGAQLVDGNYPSPYVPEDDLYAFMHGMIQGQGFTGDYTIVDYGFNENGNFVRFGNGFQICWINKTVTVAISAPYGSLFLGYYQWTFPATFTSTPTVSCSYFKWGTGASWGTINEVSTTNASLRGIDSFERSAGSTRINAVAMGWWK